MKKKGKKMVVFAYPKSVVPETTMAYNPTVAQDPGVIDDCDDIDTCNVCMENYAETRRPQSLPCGHTFCSHCLKRICQSADFKCPKCLRRYSSARSTDFPINYDLEEMISKFRRVQMSSGHRSPRHSPSPPPVGKMSSKLQCFMEDQMDSAEQLLKKSEEIVRLMAQYRTFIQERKNQHKALLPKIYELASQNEDIVERLDAEDMNMEEIQAEGEVLKDELSDSLELLRKENSITTMTEVDKHFSQLENWTAEEPHNIKDSETITRSAEILVNTSNALKGFDKDNNTRIEFMPSPLPLLEIKDNKLCSSRGWNEISLRRLTQMSSTTKNLVVSGKVFAIQELKNSIRCAKVCFQEDRFYLHYLKDADVPSSSYVIQIRELLTTITEGPVTAFLDLEWDGSIQGRVHILMGKKSPLGLQFQALCTGIMGPSYANCKFVEVACKGHPTSEAVRTGDYEKNDGSGGAPVYPSVKVKDDQYNSPLMPGVVWASFDTDGGPQISQFSITTGTAEARQYKYQRVFGKVDKGLDLLRTVASLDNVTKAKIANCGVALTFMG